MFEEKTFEDILSDALTYVADKYPDIDTNEGSMMYNALAPFAMELETAYYYMQMIMDETFLETASKEYLVKHGDQLGVAINEATYGQFKGEFNIEVEIGSRFNLEEFNYTVIELLETPDSTEDRPYWIYKLECETEGTEPNYYLGELTPITYVEGLTHAYLSEVITLGEDEEDTEAYRYRLQTHAKKPPVNGNVSQYNEWLDDYDGVGQYKVTPCWNGANTVKLTVLSPDNRAATTEKITEVQNYFDPGSRGMGDGVAPIGAIVTVDTVTEQPVTVNCEVQLNEGYESTTDIETAIVDYLNQNVLKKTTVDYMAISAVIYNHPSVSSVIKLSITVRDTIMDSSITPFTKTVRLLANEIAVPGVLSITKVD